MTAPKLYLPRLKEVRLARGFSQSDIGEVLGIRQDTYARYETGAAELPLSMLLALCRFYQVSSDYLLNQSDNSAISRRNIEGK